MALHLDFGLDWGFSAVALAFAVSRSRHRYVLAGWIVLGSELGCAVNE